jgi:hypothetical protein
MVPAIKQLVTVGPGGVVELRSPLLRPGARAEVIVVMQDESQPSPSQPRPFSSFIGAGRGAFEDSAQADAIVGEIRDWD